MDKFFPWEKIGKEVFFVLADDLTGAAEVAGICLRYGLKTTFGIDSIPKSNNFDVCVISTDSRSLTEKEAYKIHLSLAKKISKKASQPFVYKKCDSVLRGYVLTEISPLFDIFDVNKVLLQPSNPLATRCIKNGVYYIGDEKIQNTGFFSDPDFPSTTSEVSEILFQRSELYTNTSKISTGEIQKLNDVGIYIPNCGNVEELGKCLGLADEKTLLCGSAAFFEQILQKKGLKQQIKTQTNFSVSTDYLMISAGTHPQSRIFNQEMAEKGIIVKNFPEDLIQKKVNDEKILRWTDKLIAEWAKERKMILTISDKNIDFQNSSIVLKERLSLVVKKILEKCEIKELFIQGGATAYSILETINQKSLIPINELAPGVMRMKLKNKEQYITLKPGSYKWPDELLGVTVS